MSVICYDTISLMRTLSSLSFYLGVGFGMAIILTINNLIDLLREIFKMRKKKNKSSSKRKKG